MALNVVGGASMTEVDALREQIRVLQEQVRMLSMVQQPAPAVMPSHDEIKQMVEERFLAALGEEVQAKGRGKQGGGGKKQQQRQQSKPRPQPQQHQRDLDVDAEDNDLRARLIEELRKARQDIDGKPQKTDRPRLAVLNDAMESVFNNLGCSMKQFKLECQAVGFCIKNLSEYGSQKGLRKMLQKERTLRVSIIEVKVSESSTSACTNARTHARTKESDNPPPRSTASSSPSSSRIEDTTEVVQSPIGRAAWIRTSLCNAMQDALLGACIWLIRCDGRAAQKILEGFPVVM